MLKKYEKKQIIFYLNIKVKLKWYEIEGLMKRKWKNEKIWNIRLYLNKNNETCINKNYFMLKNMKKRIILNIIFYLNRKVKLKWYEIKDLKKKFKRNLEYESLFK